MGKIFTKVLNNRLTRWADINGKIDESQGAYRTGRSTADHIFSLHAMIQRNLSKRGGRFYVAFIDFSCAFDSIPHTHLWYPLRTIGAVVHGGSTIFCAGSPAGCMKPWKFQVGYSEIGCEVRQFYLNVSILFVLLLSIQVNVISLVQK